ncbi:hypothetical protein [Streptomyces sp. NBC_01477]|nr:hypothetical protein [Streptomyces sp. NBC_01477]
MPSLRTGRGSADVTAALASRDASVTARSYALLDAAGALGAIFAAGR